MRQLCFKQGITLYISVFSLLSGLQCGVGEAEGKE